MKSETGAAHGGQRVTEETRLVAGRFNKQGNLHMGLVLGAKR